jgi:hypothetical protein
MVQKSATRKAPPIPAGATVIVVPLASATSELYAGQKISLTSQGGTTVATDALVISLPEVSWTDGASGAASENTEPHASAITVAVDAKSAQAVLRNAEQAPLLAIDSTR